MESQKDSAQVKSMKGKVITISNGKTHVTEFAGESVKVSVDATKADEDNLVYIVGDKLVKKGELNTIPTETIKSMDILHGESAQAKEYQKKYNLPESKAIVVVTLK